MEVGEALVCKGESKSASDQYTVAMKKEGTFIGHLLEAVVCVLLFVVGIFCVINSCSLIRLRKNFDNKNFLLYGNYFIIRPFKVNYLLDRFLN